jgi:hypothetical protein
MPNVTRKTLLSLLLLAPWGAALPATYRWYETRYLRSFSDLPKTAHA